MTTARTLQIEDQVAHYRVVGPLGAGGMGEVYLAQDQTLERNVALKILPPELVRSEERVRRFVQEAKSASSLNHPNIVTIYEIGQSDVHSSSGEDSGSVQYISMELVSGKTLGAKIHDEKVDLRTLLGHLAQAAEGVAKAHAAGIVHRDLKPGNIMVSEDGFAKVLDFGLAKLTEKRAEAASESAMTEVAEHTSEGAVLGTVGYMSPEQVQGKSVDHRSDIFSFGCIIYEAATRRRPFTADSNVETMHKILHDKPPAIEELNPAVPAELRRLVRRCLQKSPDQRVQSMKDLALELREIADEYDELSASATSASGSSSGAVLPVGGRGIRLLPIVIGAIVIGVAGIGIGWWGIKHASKKEAAQPFTNMRLSSQTSRGDVNDAAISPDGRYLAYNTGRSGARSLRVKQIATGGDVEVLPVEDTRAQWPRFSPDGNWLFYAKRKTDAPNYRSLMKVPSLGGPEQGVAFDIDSPVTFSPDGTRICFMRGIPQEDRSILVVRDLTSGEEREFASVSSPENLTSTAAWSPDGKRIVALVIGPQPEPGTTVVSYDARSGKREDLFTRAGAFFQDVTWLADGSGLILSGADFNLGFTNQIQLLTYPGAELRRVTNDMNNYWGVTVSSGEEAIAGVRGSRLENSFVVDPAAGAPRQITSVTNPEHSPWNVLVADNGRIIFNSIRGEYAGLYVQSAEGGEPRQLPTGPGHVVAIAAGAGETIVFNRYSANDNGHIFRIDQDGSALQQLTNGSGERLLDVSPEAGLIAFAVADSTRGLWVLPVGGGESRVVSTTANAGGIHFSSDGKKLAWSEFEKRPDGLIHEVHRIAATDWTGEVATVRPPAQSQQVTFTIAGDALSYVDRADPAWNVYRLAIGGDTPQQITRFTDGRVLQYYWSPDGSRLLMERRIGAAESAWLTDADGGNASELPPLAAPEIFRLCWFPDGKRILVTGGASSSDAILVRNFR